MSTFVVTLTGELASKKNGKLIRKDRRGRILGLIENDTVRRVEANLIAQLLAASPGARRPMFDGQSCELSVTIDKDQDITHVAIREIGPRPKGKTGRRRDIQNELGLVCDALERAGIVANDNQFARILVTRIVNQTTA